MGKSLEEGMRLSQKWRSGGSAVEDRREVRDSYYSLGVRRESEPLFLRQGVSRGAFPVRREAECYVPERGGGTGEKVTLHPKRRPGASLA